MSNQKIVIVGFMGTGKSTVAEELGRKLNSQVFDLDELIFERERRSAGKIIEQDGESKFREVETRLLSEVLEPGPARIIAVGGGAWTIAENRWLIATQGASTAWLDAPFELCWKRIEADRELRPLARSREMAERLYRERRQVYELADVRIPVSESESAPEIATKVANAISQLRPNPSDRGHPL